MPVQTFTKREDIPAELADKVIEAKDGSFYHFADEDTKGLKSALDKERDAAKEAKRIAAEERAKREAFEAEAKAREAGLTGEKLAEIRAQAEAKFKADLDERDRLKQENRTLRLDTQAKSLLAGLVPDVDAAWKLIGSDYDLTDDGKAIVKGDPTADVKAHLTQTQKEKYPWLFLGTGAAGGAGTGGRGGAGGGTAKPPTAWTADERSEFLRTHGAEAYQTLLQKEATDRLTAKTKAA